MPKTTACERWTKPCQFLRHILKLTRPNNFNSNHLSAPYPAASQQHIDLSRYRRAACPVQAGQRRDSAIGHVGKMGSETLSAAASHQHLPLPCFFSVYCHTVCQQHPEVMDLASRVEHCSTYSHRTWSTHHALLQDLKQRIKFQIKKSHNNIFPLLKQKHIICVKFNFFIYTHVWINFPHSPSKGIQLFSYSGIFSYSNKKIRTKNLF